MVGVARPELYYQCVENDPAAPGNCGAPGTEDTAVHTASATPNFQAICSKSHWNFWEQYVYQYSGSSGGTVRISVTWTDHPTGQSPKVTGPMYSQDTNPGDSATHSYTQSKGAPTTLADGNTGTVTFDLGWTDPHGPNGAKGPTLNYTCAG